MYINFMTDENKNIYIPYWLLLSTFLVALMIIVGGLTRLTNSGLSITKWELFSGILPPLSLNDWKQLFSFYQQIPEYKLVNSSMTLEEFKVIFWWEYIHRLLGRIVGLFYIIPLIYFTYRKMINKNFKKLFNENKSISKDLNLNLNVRPEELNNEIYYKIAMQYEKLSV